VTLFDLESGLVPMIAGLLADPILLHRLFAVPHDDPSEPRSFREPLSSELEGERRLGRIRDDTDMDAVSLLLIGFTAILALTGHVVPGASASDSGRLQHVVDTLLRGLRPS
jgi:hypothetical protein